jgi:hypothetical protein
MVYNGATLAGGPVSTSPLLAPMDKVAIIPCISRAFQLYGKALPWFVGWGLTVSLFQAAMGVVTAGWALLLGLAVIVPLNVGLYAIADAAANGDRVDLDTILTGFKRGPAYALGILQTVLLVAGLLLFVLPVLIVLPALTWTVPALHRRKMAALDAVVYSAGLAKRHLGLTLAVMGFAFLLDSLATSTIVLGAFTLPLMACLKTVVFEQIARRD